MSNRQKLESLLSERGLAAPLRAPAAASGAQDADALARLFTEGPPQRAITELVPEDGGGGNAGLASMAARIAAVVSHEEGARLAWVDPQDRWDPASAQAAGVALEKVLWLRGSPVLAGLSGLGRWHQALGLLIQAGGMNTIVADFSSWPARELRRMPRSAWFQLLRGLERSQRTALLLLAPEPLTQSCAALVAGLRYGPVVWQEGSVPRLRQVPVQGRLLRRRFHDSAGRRPAQSEAPLHLSLELPA